MKKPLPARPLKGYPAKKTGGLAPSAHAGELLMSGENDSALSQRLIAILNLVEDGVYLSDKDGKTIWVNRAYEELTGQGIEHFKDRNVRELVETGVFNTVLNPQIVRTKKPASVVQELGRNKKTIVLRGFPIFDESGEVDLVVTFARDITAITKLREQIAEQRTIIEQYQGRVAHILEHRHGGEGIFVSKAMQDMLPPLIRSADTDATVLLLGETGVGKDVLARLVHSHSPRKDKIFLKVDCASIAENLIESELFGYVKGAFSGAVSQGKAGFFEIADGGTVFLDEIGELPLPMQSKLLRVLQDKEFMRVGSSRPQRVDVRIIAATNRNLAEDSEKGLFRRDLYYRLNVARFAVPSLRERQADIPVLAQHFLDTYNQKYKKHVHLSARAIQALVMHPWPGNIRELQNLVLRLVITSEHELADLKDLPKAVREHVVPLVSAPPAEAGRLALPSESLPLKKLVGDMEATLLKEALSRFGSVNKVAEFFQINRSTIFRKLHIKDNGGF